MSVETETILMKLLEELKAESKETNKRLNSIEVNQAIQGEQIKSLQKGQDELKADFGTFRSQTKENFKEVKSELKETRNDVSGLDKWFTATLSTAGIGAGTILLRVFDLFPKA